MRHTASLAQRHQPTAMLETQLSHDRATLIFHITGRVDTNSTGKLWRQASHVLEQARPTHVVIDASAMSYCDGAGVAFFVKLRQYEARSGGRVTIHGLKDEFRRLLDLYGEVSPATPIRNHRELSMVEKVGHVTIAIWQDVQVLLTFVGELMAMLVRAGRNPRLVRWSDAWLHAERAGVDALPIIALIGFLLGLILSFQSAIPMRRFGAEIFVANLVGVSMLREMGPLITAIVLAGRSGSAFAAELGTMKVREEIDALVTMGLEPVRFLVVPRVLAAISVTPILSVFANIFGLVGGALVMLSLGFPLITYLNQILSAVTVGDFLGGLVKAFVYGIVVAGIGCLRGLQTTTDASGVGKSTTSAVVSGIVLIAMVDGLFAVVYYALGV
jgi:phospholipid/cholesterol/gamma-HCH transport system permease protein